MKQFFAFFFIVGMSLPCLAQKFTMNQGGALQKNYFTVIPYENVNDKLIINVEIDGKKRRFMLDTGAPNAITKTLFDEIKATIIKKIPVRDQSEKMDTLAVASVNKITFGEVDFENVPALVLENNSRIIADCFGIDGLIGSNMLRKSVVQFDSKSKTITLTDDAKKLSLNKKESSDLELNKYQSSPLVQIRVKKEKIVKETLLFDTGANTFYDLSLNSFNVFKKNGVINIFSESVGSNSYGMFGTSNDSTTYRVLIPELSINQNLFQNVVSNTSIGSESLIGSKIFNYGIVTVDYKNKKFYFRSFDAVNNLEEKLFPIDFSSKNGKLIIGVVWDKELAEKLHVGDIVVEVNGINYENKNFCDLILESSILKEKDKLVLVTRNSGGQLLNTTIVRK